MDETGYCLQSTESTAQIIGNGTNVITSDSQNFYSFPLFILTKDYQIDKGGAWD